ncbi:intramembrane protease 2 [Lojkania enalia]|uniref:Intramembrane protease 2 n=1 Tax=Lojkania enalia TaxID=147567 RepID=A0A9P4N802_9PLEO|nr:intramembrane protease 2 [Didymosphaeria enalia]
MTEPALLARVLGQAAYQFSLIQPMIPTYIHLLGSALFPIYAGAHASLTRPSSAAKPKKRKPTRSRPIEESEDDDEEEEYKMEGLSPVDAILMPVLAGTTLAGLYFLIKWLGDPALLNKILNAYFALFGVFSVARLITDVLDIGHSLIFPRRYAFRGVLYHVDAHQKKAMPGTGETKDSPAILSPLPGFLARIPLSVGLRNMIWSDRAMPGNKWTLRIYIHRIFAGKVRIGPHGVFGFLAAVATVAYFNFVDKPWFLTNLMGFGFSYNALQFMSPTTFGTGSLILGALFFYDIYFVFFTPMMVIVAKSLDIPIKLVFPRPQVADAPPSHAMLGLGDVVLPGIMIGLALRFDLFLFYLRRQKHVQLDEAEGELQVVKPKYFSLAGRWSDHFWTHSLTGRPLFSTSQDSKCEAPFTFPKIYFTASLIGYVVGMLATLGVMHFWGHAQPALLYLVPGVLGSLWLTALARGELGLMWGFSEAEGEEEESSKKGGQKEKPAPERSSFFSISDRKAKEREARMNEALRKHVTHDSHSEDEKDTKNDAKDAKVREVAGHRSDREVFSFSVEAPWTLKHPRSILHSSKTTNDVSGPKENEDPEQSPLEKDKPNWAPQVHDQKVLEPPGKRLRLN